MKRLLQAIILGGGITFVGCQDATRPDAEGPQFSRGQGQLVPDRYIVLFADRVADPASVARGLAQAHGLTVRHVYGTAVKGFVGTIPAARLNAVRSDPRVVLVEQERAFELEELPTGVDRIEADKVHERIAGTGTAQVDGHVAMIDTGIDEDHPYLNVVGGSNFAGGPSGNYGDGNGHGTHTAGTVGAYNNTIGVVGVAPGVSLYAVRVCKNGGICMTGDIVAGINWVAAQKSSGNINFSVANMSIGTTDDASACSTSSGAVHRAICGLVNTGVVFVLAAGNNGREKKAYPEAMTVSAIADFDGKGGGSGASTCRSDVDETLANFSNYGPSIDIAAPGVCILSTWNDGGTNTISGTSMAAPHVAGAVALYIHVKSDVSPATDGDGVDAIELAIITAALPQGITGANPCSYNNEKNSGEPLLFVNGSAFGGNGTCDLATPPTPITDIAVTAVNVPASVTQGETVDVVVTVENLGNQDVGSNIAVTLTDETDVSTIGTHTIAGGLSAGGSTTVMFSWQTTDLPLGDRLLTGSHSFADGVADNNSRSTTVTIVTEPPAGTGPSVTGCSPSSASPNTRPLVTVSGSNFQDGATVDFGPQIAVQNVTFIEGGKLEVQIKVHRRAQAGSRDVTVTNPDGQRGIGESCFTVN